MYKFLRRFRQVWGCLALAAFLWIFVSVTGTLASRLTFLLQWQFVPAFITALFGGGMAVLSVLLLLTLVLGRVYCSFLCPLGLYQDAVNRVAGWFKTKKQRRFAYHAGWNPIRYGVLAVVVAALFFGVTWPLVYSDPYGIFGKVAASLGRAAVLTLHNGVAAVLPARVFYQSYHAFTGGAVAVAAVLFAVVTAVSLRRGRLYCNLICPVGSLLGLVSKVSMFRMQVDPNKCRHCTLCGLKCKAECLDSAHLHVDYSRCVMCFNCAAVCREHAVRYVFAWGRGKKAEAKPEPAKIDPKRRKFLLVATGLVAGVAMGGALAGIKKKVLDVKKMKMAGSMPPGAGSLAHLKDRCIACHACVAACPSKIIRPARGEYGLDGFMLPVIHYDNGFCAYDCRSCMEACPTGALQIMPLERKRVTRLGVASNPNEHCIIKKYGTACGACEEHCPVKALRMEPDGKTGLMVPKMHGRYCIGCGACEYICPATPKAIKVHSLELQKTAERPETEKQEAPTEVGFGF